MANNESVKLKLLEKLKGLDPETQLSETNSIKEIKEAIAKAIVNQEAQEPDEDEPGEDKSDDEVLDNNGDQPSAPAVETNPKKETGESIFYVPEFGMNVRAKNTKEAAAKAKKILERK